MNAQTHRLIFNNGKTTQVLVPQVYVPQVYLRRPQSGDLQASGALISGSDVTISA